jgi:hypothetical protein
VIGGPELTNAMVARASDLAVAVVVEASFWDRVGEKGAEGATGRPSPHAQVAPARPLRRCQRVPQSPSTAVLCRAMLCTSVHLLCT